MGFKPYSDLKYTVMPEAVAMFNAIRAEASEQYKERIPAATQKNISDVANPLLTYPTLYNEWYSALVSRIAFTVISSKMYNNPLKSFKKGLVQMGRTVQEIFVDLIKAEPFYTVDAQGMTASEDLLKQRLANIVSMYHTRDRQDKYPISISYDNVRDAFTSWEAIDNLIRKQIEAVYASDEYDEFLLMKNLFRVAGERGALAEVVIPDGTDRDTLDEIMVILRSMVLNTRFRTTKYNFAQVSTFSNTEDLVLFVLPELYSRLSVKTLAGAFNVEYADFLSRVVVVDDFGGLEAAGVKFIMADRDWFQVYDNLFTMRTQENGARLYDNFFLHHWQTLSFSPFKTAIAFTTKPSVVNSVTINPTDLTLTRNNSDNPTATLLQATVEGEGMYNPGVVWSTTIGSISPDGLLEVPNNWEKSEGVVTAISKQDGSVLDTINVRLTPNSSVTKITATDANGIVLSNTTQVITRTTHEVEYPLYAILEGNALQTEEMQWFTDYGEIRDGNILKLTPDIPVTEIHIDGRSVQDSSKRTYFTINYLPARGVYSNIANQPLTIGITYIGMTGNEEHDIPISQIDVKRVIENGGSVAYGYMRDVELQYKLNILSMNSPNNVNYVGVKPRDIIYMSNSGRVVGEYLFIKLGDVLTNLTIRAYIADESGTTEIASSKYPFTNTDVGTISALWITGTNELLLKGNFNRIGEYKLFSDMFTYFGTANGNIRLVLSNLTNPEEYNGDINIVGVNSHFLLTIRYAWKTDHFEEIYPTHVNPLPQSGHRPGFVTSDPSGELPGEMSDEPQVLPTEPDEPGIMSDTVEVVEAAPEVIETPDDVDVSRETIDSEEPPVVEDSEGKPVTRKRASRKKSDSAES